MRTPLAVILNGAEVVKIAPDLALAKRAATKISSNATRLNEMMAELLDALTSKGGGQLPLNLSSFDIEELVDEVRGACHLPGASVEADAQPVFGYWCQNSMRRALENLVNNAWKYGDPARVNIKATQTHGRLLLSVHNMGNPIPKERQGAIFDYLTRGEEDSTVGWGIGLPFVKRVAESHGGSVAVDSSTETGTTFFIDIPVDCRPYVRSLASPPSPPA